MTGRVARAVLVVVVALLVGAAAYAFSTSQEKEYESTLTFGYGRLLSPEYQLLGQFEPDVEEETRIRTEAALIESHDVAEATARAAPELGLSAGEIGARVSAEPERGTLLVRVRARAPEAMTAARLAEAFGDAYVKLRIDRERRQAAAVERALRAELRSLPRLVRLGPRGAKLRDQITTFGVVRRTGSGNPRIVEHATVPGGEAEPQTTRNVLFGLLFGLLLGIGLVGLRAEGRARSRARARRASRVTRGKSSTQA